MMVYGCYMSSVLCLVNDGRIFHFALIIVSSIDTVKSMHLFTGHNPGYYTPHLTLGRNLLYSEVFDSGQRQYRQYCKIFVKTS